MFVVSGKGTPNMERQTWSGGLGSWWDRVSLLTSVDVIDGRVNRAIDRSMPDANGE